MHLCMTLKNIMKANHPSQLYILIACFRCTCVKRKHPHSSLNCYYSPNAVHLLKRLYLDKLLRCTYACSVCPCNSFLIALGKKSNYHTKCFVSLRNVFNTKFRIVIVIYGNFIYLIVINKTMS